MMKRMFLLSLVGILPLLSCQKGDTTEETQYTEDGKRIVSFTMRTEEGSLRNENLIEGIEFVNATLDSDVVLQYAKRPKPDETTELMQFKSGVYADFNWNTHSDIGWMVETGLIQPVDWIQDLECFASMPDSIAQKVRFDGQLYAIPYDAVLTMSYINRNALAGLGWTDDEIDGLEERIRVGDFTLQDLSTVAKEAMDEGLVKYGFLMNRVEWNTLFALSEAFDAWSYDWDQQKLVLSKEKWTEYFQWWYDILNRDEIVTRGLTGMSEDSITRILLDGDVMFYVGYDGYRNLRKQYDGDLDDFEDWLYERYLVTLPPSGRQGRQATTNMKVFALFVSSKTSEEKIELLKQIVSYSWDHSMQAKTNLNNLSIPVSSEVLEEPAMQNVRYIREAVPHIESANAWASHPYYHQYLIQHKKTIEDMIVNGITAEEAYKRMRDELVYNVDKEELILQE